MYVVVVEKLKKTHSTQDKTLNSTNRHTYTHKKVKLQKHKKQTRNIVACQLYAKPKDKNKKIKIK